MKNLLKFGSLHRRRLYEEVADALKQAILKGDYHVGDKLPSENELEDLFQVSRAVIREAIRYLEITGLVTIKQGATGGAFVSEINSKILQGYMRDLLNFGYISVKQLSEVRAYVDPEVARLAALHANEKDLQDLEQSVLLSKTGVPGEEYVKNNAGFHRILGRASQNLVYAVIEDCLVELVIEYVLTIKPADQIVHDHKEHEAIYNAVKEGNAVRAAKITKKHVEFVSKQLMDLETDYLNAVKGDNA